MTDDVNFKHTPQAKVIADSVSPAGHRLTTLEVVMHRFVLAEFNTHRVFSRNSASSRAIPFRKQVERVMNHPAVPVRFPAEQRGMQGGEELGDLERDRAEHMWYRARGAAVENAQVLADLGVHKSVVNRLLEPFMWHTVIVTATDWDGFWHQRCSPEAQPEIMVAAEAMMEAYDDSSPRSLGYDEWHMPYIDDEDFAAAESYVENQGGDYGRVAKVLKQVSAARCARVSYLTHDGQRSIEKDIELFDRLVRRDDGDDSPVHWSPLEHVATPARSIPPLGNFTGWHQLRHLYDN